MKEILLIYNIIIIKHVEIIAHEHWVMINQIKTGALQSHHCNLPLANRNQSRSQQNDNPYICVIIT